jgi:hypothetical protein
MMTKGIAQRGMIELLFVVDQHPLRLLRQPEGTAEKLVVRKLALGFKARANTSISSSSRMVLLLRFFALFRLPIGESSEFCSSGIEVLSGVILTLGT